MTNCVLFLSADDIIDFRLLLSLSFKQFVYTFNNIFTEARNIVIFCVWHDYRWNKLLLLIVAVLNKSEGVWIISTTTLFCQNRSRYLSYLSNSIHLFNTFCIDFNHLFLSSRIFPLLFISYVYHLNSAPNLSNSFRPRQICWYSQYLLLEISNAVSGTPPIIEMKIGEGGNDF